MAEEKDKVFICFPAVRMKDITRNAILASQKTFLTAIPANIMKAAQDGKFDADFTLEESLSVAACIFLLEYIWTTFCADTNLKYRLTLLDGDDWHTVNGITQIETSKAVHQSSTKFRLSWN